MPEQIALQQARSDKNQSSAIAHPASSSGLALPAVPAFALLQPVIQPAAAPVAQRMLRKQPNWGEKRDHKRPKIIEQKEDREEQRQNSTQQEGDTLEQKANTTEQIDPLPGLFFYEEEKKEKEPEDNEEELKIPNEKDEEEPEQPDPRKVITRSENMGTYGNLLLANMSLTEIPEVKGFLSWAAGENIKVDFKKATGGKGAGAETFIEVKTGQDFIPIDDPARPFTEWDLLKKDSEIRILVKMYKTIASTGYIDPIHELVVHAMDYQPFVKSIRQMTTGSPDTESALLFYFYQLTGDISAAKQHEIHGEKHKKGSMKSGFDNYIPLVKEQQEKLKGYKNRQTGEAWAQQLGKSAENDLKMQAAGTGNLNARRTYADNSMELLIAWLAGEKITSFQQQSCMDLEKIDETWANILLLYNHYLEVSGQEICKNSALMEGIYAQGAPGNTQIANWLNEAITDFNIAFLNHIAATGEVQGQPYNMDTRQRGTQVSTAEIIGGEQRRLLQDETQALIAYRGALAKKTNDTFDWSLLRTEEIEKRRTDK